MSTSYFEPVGAGGPPATQRFDAREHCTGPWSADAMHGGPPSALLVRACEQVVAAAGGTGLLAVRTAVDFLAPVPVAQVEVTARVVRPGRRVALAEATLSAGGRDVLVARTWLLAVADPPVVLPDDLTEAGVTLPEPDLCPPVGGDRWDFPYGRSIDWRVVGGTHGRGDATVWGRARLPLLAGEEPSGLQCAVLVADSSSGVSAGLDWDLWQFVNVDLTVHLTRPLVGDWVCLDAHSRYASSGTGLARSTLHDELGVVGSSAQSLVVAPSRR